MNQLIVKDKFAYDNESMICSIWISELWRQYQIIKSLLECADYDIDVR